MNNIKFEKCNWNKVENHMADYYRELGYKNDGFHNSMLLEGEPYMILLDETVTGFFSVGTSWDGGRMLRGFYIVPSKRNASITIFNKVVEDFVIEAVLVASNDSHLIGLAFEKMNALKTSLDMQAFNFVYGEPSREPEYGMDSIVEVSPNEYEHMNVLTEGQWEDSFGDENFKFYALKQKDEILGYGSIGRFNYNSKNADIGNFTLLQHRRKGVGRSLIINLSKIAIEQGLIPVAGCWYGNNESIATLTSSGYIPENGIFYVRFK